METQLQSTTCNPKPLTKAQKALRLELAMVALGAIISKHKPVVDDGEEPLTVYDEAAAGAFRYADAMMKEMAK